jgi:hypothetical protein
MDVLDWNPKMGHFILDTKKKTVRILGGDLHSWLGAKDKHGVLGEKTPEEYDKILMDKNVPEQWKE